MRATGRTDADRLNADSARHLEKQCTGGDFTACLALADLYDAGHGVEQSIEKVAPFSNALVASEPRPSASEPLLLTAHGCGQRKGRFGA